MSAVTNDEVWPGFGGPVTVAELRDPGYVRTAISTQPLTLSRPFTVTVAPADLTKGLVR